MKIKLLISILWILNRKKNVANVNVKINFNFNIKLKEYIHELIFKLYYFLLKIFILINYYVINNKK